MIVKITKDDIEGNCLAYMGIADAIEQKILSGEIAPGDKLPTQRDLADDLQINLSTVSRGYREAARRRLIAGVTGRGTFVSTTMAVSDNKIVFQPDVIEMGLVLPIVENDLDISEPLMECLGSEKLNKLMTYTDNAGWPEHRLAGAKWLEHQGIAASADDIVICAGLHHAMTCCLSYFRAGTKVAVNCFVYPFLKNLAGLLGIMLVPINMDENGMVPEHLDTICRRDKVLGIHIMSVMQNPTTITMPENRKDEIAKIIQHYHLTVIESHSRGVYDSTRYSSLLSRVPDQGFYISGLSKSFWAGLKIAYLLTPNDELRQHALKAIACTIWMASPLSAQIAMHLINSKTANVLIEKKFEEAKLRFELVEKYLTDYEYLGYCGCLFVWLRLPPPLTGRRFEREALNRGVKVFCSENFAITIPREQAVRISLSGPDNLQQTEMGLKILSELLKEMVAQG